MTSIVHYLCRLLLVLASFCNLFPLDCYCYIDWGRLRDWGKKVQWDTLFGYQEVRVTCIFGVIFYLIPQLWEHMCKDLFSAAPQAN